jgi:aspartyl protease family protein
MTHRPPRWLYSWVLAVLPAASALAVAADPPSDAVLKEKGLRKSGTVYVLPGEAEVQKKLNTAKALYRAASVAAAQKHQYEQGAQEARSQIQQMEQQYVMLNQQLSQTPAGPAHNQLVAMVNALGGQINLMRRQGSDETKQVVGARLANDRESFLQAVLDLRKLIDKTNEQYAALAADEEVKAVLEGLNRAGTTKLKYALGPSKAYQANVKLLEKVEASVLTENVELRKEGGVYWVDVTINGKVTRPMVFDTGASTVVLPADLASQIGLTPGPDTPTMPAQVADGSEVIAHKMVIPSLRLGKFTVNNVECIVMPEGKKNVPPLLGQTFQRFFSVHFSPEAGKLSLSKIETEDSAAPAPAGGAAGKAKSKAPARGGRGR